MSRDEQAGVTPLRGEPSSEAGQGPARGYSWPPFGEGNTAALRHGAYSDAVVAPRAREILAGLLEDPQMPGHVRSPAWRYQAKAWARAEAIADVLYEHVAEMGAEGMMTPKLAGTKSPVDIWRAADAHAGRLRARLGLDPVAYAGLAKDLGLASRAIDDNLVRMSGEGAEMVRRKAAELGWKAPGAEVIP